MLPKLIKSTLIPRLISIEKPNAVDLALHLLRKGDVIAVPTDTVYGLACRASDPRAVEKLCQIKLRCPNRPIATCVGEIRDVRRLCATTHLPEGVLSSLLPGPATLLLERAANARLKVGIRIPDHEFSRSVANRSNFPIALTSANISGERGSVEIDDFRLLWDKVGAVFVDQKRTAFEYLRNGSTVIDLTKPGAYRIVRSGVAKIETTNILRNCGLKEF